MKVTLYNVVMGLIVAILAALALVNAARHEWNNVFCNCVWILTASMCISTDRRARKKQNE